MDIKEDISLMNQVNKKFKNYLFPELEVMIYHHLLNNKDVAFRYFKEHITPEFILNYLTQDNAVINSSLKEEDILNKIIRIVEEGHLYD